MGSPEKILSPKGFTHSEAEVAQCFGVPESQVRAWRQERLAEGGGFRLHPAEKTALWCPLAVFAFQADLAMQAQAASISVEELVEAPTKKPARPTFKVKITRVNLHNRRILLGLIGKNQPVRLVVAHNANFLPGMEVEAFHHSTDPVDLYRYEGSLPRQRGKW